MRTQETTPAEEIEFELNKLRNDFNSEIEVIYKKYLGNRNNNENNYNNNSNNNYSRRNNYSQIKDTVLPQEIATNSQLAKHLMTNGPCSVVINGKEMKLTYSIFSKSFYVTNSNNIIIGEPIHCSSYDANVNEYIKEWKQANRLYLNRNEKYF